MWTEEPKAEGWPSSSVPTADYVSNLSPRDHQKFNFLNKSFFAGFAGAGVVGLSNAYPDLKKFLNDYTTAEGKEILAKYQESGYCLAQVAIGNPFTDFYKASAHLKRKNVLLTRFFRFQLTTFTSSFHYFHFDLPHSPKSIS